MSQARPQRLVSKATVLASWSSPLIEALAASAIDPVELLQAVGFERDAFADPNARHPVTDIARLWRRAAERVGDPAFGLRVAEYVRYTSAHALGYAVFASATLRDALERMVRFQAIVTDACQLALHSEGEQACLSALIAPGYQLGADEQIDAGASCVLRACRLLVGRDFPLRQVTLSRTPPTDVAPYERFFGVPVRFARENKFVFDASCLDSPLKSSNSELARVNDAAAQEYLTRLSERVAERARRAIRARLRKHDLSPARVARDLGTSVRSLQRALLTEGTTYEDLLTDVRKALACELLDGKRLQISEIAFELGYARASTFHRAFKRWLGYSPSEYQTRR